MDIFTHLYIFLAMIEPFFASPYDGPFLVLSRKDICPSEIYRSVKNIMPPHISPEVCRAYNQPYLQILRGIPQKNFVEEAYQPNTVINKWIKFWGKSTVQRAEPSSTNTYWRPWGCSSLIIFRTTQREWMPWNFLSAWDSGNCPSFPALSRRAWGPGQSNHARPDRALPLSIPENTPSEFTILGWGRNLPNHLILGVWR